MSRNENVDNAIWQDEPFASLSAAGKLTYMWSWTNQLCGMAGLYKVRRQQVELDTAQTRGAVEGALGELRQHAMLYYVEGVVWVVARVPRLVTQTPQIAKSIARDVARVPPGHPLKEVFLGWYWDSSWPGSELRKAFETEGRLRVTRGSVEGHEKADVIEELLRVTRPSREPLSVSASASAVATTPAERPQTVVARDAWRELPEPLRLVAPLVAETLERVAAVKGSKPVKSEAVCRVLAAFPDHDHRQLVGDFEHYWCFGAGERTRRPDIVATYRNRCGQVVARPAWNGSASDAIDRILAYGQADDVIEGSVAE